MSCFELMCILISGHSIKRCYLYQSSELYTKTLDIFLTSWLAAKKLC